MKILVTAGATREPIDAVRYLSNIGTGKTGALVADALGARGHDVTLLAGPGAFAPEKTAEVEAFSSAEDLGARLQRRLVGGDYDAVIMTAAVADYRPREIQSGKMASGDGRLTLQLVRNPKLLPQLKSFSPRPLFVAGFKLTVGADAASRRQAVAEQFAHGGIDLVVHNDLEDIRRAAAHPFWIHRAAEVAPIPAEGPAALALALEAEFIRLRAESPGALR